MQIAKDASEAAQATDAGDAASAPAPATAPATRFDEAVLQNSAEFYKWHSELEATRTSETEEKFRRYAATLQGYLDACGALLSKAHLSRMPALDSSAYVVVFVVGRRTVLHAAQSFELF